MLSPNVYICAVFLVSIILLSIFSLHDTCKHPEWQEKLLHQRLHILFEKRPDSLNTGRLYFHNVSVLSSANLTREELNTFRKIFQFCERDEIVDLKIEGGCIINNIRDLKTGNHYVKCRSLYIKGQCVFQHGADAVAFPGARLYTNGYNESLNHFETCERGRWTAHLENKRNATIQPKCNDFNTVWSFNVSKTTVIQELSISPEFTVDNLEFKDLFHLIKLFHFTEPIGSTLEISVEPHGVCEIPDNFNTSVDIDETARCQITIKDYCVMIFNNTKIALPGTELRYKCQNAISKSAHCSQGRWSPSDINCDEINVPINDTSKQETDQSAIPNFNSKKCGQSTIKPTASGFDNFVAKEDLVNMGEFPWHTGLYDKTANESGPICGATIISSKVLLTASRCVTGRKENNLQVAVGKLKIETTEENSVAKFYEVNRIVEYINPSCGDIHCLNNLAIIETKDEITFNEAVSQICLPLSNKTEKLEDGVQLHTAGWGAGWSGDGKRATDNDYMTKTTLRYISNAFCHNTMLSNFSSYLTEDKFCTGKFNDVMFRDTDVGAALVMKQSDDAYYLVGVVDMIPADQPNLVFCTSVNLPKYLDWINLNIYRGIIENQSAKSKL